MTRYHVKNLIAACLCMFVLSFGLSGLSIYLVPWTEKFNVPSASFSVSMTLTNLVGVVMTPIIGRKVLPKLNLRLTVLLCAILGAFAYFLYSVATSLIVIYLAAAIMGVILLTGTSVAASTLTGRWFDKNIGKTMGVVSAMSGLSGTMLSAVIPRLIDSVGVSNSYRIEGAAWFVLLFLAYLLMDNSPFKLGLTPYGAETYTEPCDIPHAEPDAKEDPDVETKAELKSVTRMPAFWIFVGTFFFFGVAMGMSILLHTFFVSRGMTLTEAGHMASVMFFSMIIVKLILGHMSDKLGPNKTFVIAALVFILTFVTLFVTRNLVINTIVMVTFAFGSSTAYITQQLMIRKRFGQKHFAAVYTSVNSAYSLGLAGGSVLLSHLYDLTKSFQTSLGVAIFCLVCSVSIFPLSKKRSIWDRC